MKNMKFFLVIYNENKPCADYAKKKMVGGGGGGGKKKV